MFWIPSDMIELLVIYSVVIAVMFVIIWCLPYFKYYCSRRRELFITPVHYPTHYGFKNNNETFAQEDV